MPDILAQLHDVRSGLGTSSHVRVLPSASDVTVALLEDASGSVVSVIKVPRTEQGRCDLQTQESVLALLEADDRLGPWRQLLPAYRLRGSEERTFAFENLVPGADATGVLAEHPTRVDAVVSLALATIDELHLRTARTMLVDDAVLDRWLVAPVALLRCVHPSGRVPQRQQLALDRIEARLRSVLLGRWQTVSWVHGDFVPGNVMFAHDASRVTGVLDWAQAHPDGLPALDHLLWLVCVECHRHSRQLGQLVGEALCWPDWPDDPILGRARIPIRQSGVEHRDLILWCWLQHVTGNIQKSARYGRHPLWWGANVDPVLEAVVS
jgi:hypothetical protein